MSITLTDTILTIRDLSLSYGDKPILKDINIEIKNIVDTESTKGQIIAFLGASGSGKTQLCRIIAGLQAPTKGEIRIGVEQKPVTRGDVGFVFQSCALFRNRTVRGNLEITGAPKDKIKEYIEYFTLEDHQRKYPIQLSGGQRQRVAIAQQLLASDHFIIMDEPFSGLDIHNTNKACELITRVANQHELNTVIVVTHDIHAAISIADEVWLMGRTPEGSVIKDRIYLLDKELCYNGIRGGSLYADIVERFKGLWL